MKVSNGKDSHIILFIWHYTCSMKREGGMGHRGKEGRIPGEQDGVGRKRMLVGSRERKEEGEGEREVEREVEEEKEKKGE